MNTFLISDTHFGHSNILTFKRDSGEPLRGFSSIEEHDEYLIQAWNKTVGKKDKVYHLGDVGFKSYTKLKEVMDRLHGEKILIKGNHDNLKPQQYLSMFKDVRACHQLAGYLLTHIPIHPQSISRWKGNIHGHLHDKGLDDWNYMNVSVERLIDYSPISLEEVNQLFEGR